MVTLTLWHDDEKADVLKRGCAACTSNTGARRNVTIPFILKIVNKCETVVGLTTMPSWLTLGSYIPLIYLRTKSHKMIHSQTRQSQVNQEHSFTQPTNRCSYSRPYASQSHLKYCCGVLGLDILGTWLFKSPGLMKHLQ